MIHCQLVFPNHFFSVSDTFCHFSLVSLNDLVAELRQKLSHIKKIQSHELLELKVELIFENELDIKGIDRINIDILKNFVCSQEGVLLRFKIINPDHHILLNLQHTLDAAVLVSFKNFLKQPQSVSVSSLVGLFKDKLPELTLNKVIPFQEANSSVVASSLPSFQYQKLEPIHIPEPKGILANYTNHHHPGFQAYQHILKCISLSMISKIVYSVGVEGLERLCFSLSMFSEEDWTLVYQLFFEGDKEQELFLMVFPSGLDYLRLIDAWPKALIKYWLTWLINSNSSHSFTDAIRYMHEFWQEIKDVYPSIPNVNKEISSYPFQARLQEMEELLLLVSPFYKKLQIERLFKLQWRSMTFYKTIFSTTSCLFICEEMFDAQMELTRYSLYDYSGISRKSHYFQYVSQHIRDSLSPTDLIFDYSDYIDASPIRTQEASWQLAAWCASSIKLIGKADFIQFHDFIISAAIDDQKEILGVLYALSSHQASNLSMIQKMLQLANDDVLMFRQFLQFYHQWLICAPRSYLDSWSIVFEFLNQSNKPDIFREILALAQHLKLKNYSFLQCYFKTLLLLFAEHNAISFDAVHHLTNDFNAFSDTLQAQLIAIFSSYETQQIPLELDSLQLIFECLKHNRLSVDEAFSTYLPNSSFKYFKNVIDYHLVFSKMENLLVAVESGLNFFLGDERIKPFIPPIRTMLLSDAVTHLSSQLEHLKLVKKELLHLQSKNYQIDVGELFAHFKKIDDFFGAFLERKLGDTFSSFLFYLLPRLDRQLNTDNTIKSLMQTVLNRYHLIQKTNLSQFLTYELLSILVDVSDVPLMQRFLEYFLVHDLILQLEKEVLLKMRDSNVPVIERKKLALFLNTLPMDVRALKEFFIRYQGILLVINQWQEIEEALNRLNLHPELPSLIWKICAEAQSSNGKLYSSLHWNMVIFVLKNSILFLEKHPGLNFSLAKYIEAFFKATSSLQTIELNSNGELWHVHWEKLFILMNEAILRLGKNPLFFNIVPQAIDSILTTGLAFDFEKNMQFFDKLGGDTKLLNQLTQLAGKDLAFADELPRILEQLVRATKLEKTTHRPWVVCFIKLLNAPDLDAHLLEINKIYDWLFAHDDFDWLEIISDDPNCSIQALTDLINLMESDSLLSQSYYAKFKKPLILVEEVKEIEIQIEEPMQLKPIGFWSVLSNKVSNFFNTEPSLPFSEDDEKDELVLESEEVLSAQDDSHTQFNELVWATLKTPPYPSIALMISWFSKQSSDIEDDLVHFDTYPLGLIKEYIYSEIDMTRWMQDLVFYDSQPPDKDKTEKRLRSVLGLSNIYFTQSRQALLRLFQELKQMFEDQESTVIPLDIQNQLLGVLVALYYKSTGRKPYPTQVLTLIINMAYQHRNVIFEVDTGEGKAITAAILAVLKLVFNPNSTVEVRTANKDLVHQDYYVKGHWRFFKLLAISHAIVFENSSFETYCEGGINYTTEQDMIVFKEICRLQNREIASNSNLNIIQDEVDHAILEQTSMVNLIRGDEYVGDMSWLYILINLFIDSYFEQDTQYSLSDWGKMLKKAIVEQCQGAQYRLSLISYYQDEKWQDWVELGVYAKLLKENQHYIVEMVEHHGSISYQVVPYINSEIKYGFDIAYQTKLGLKQLLHARLSSEKRSFKVESEGELLSQLAPSNLRQIKSFVGLSGSIGALSECRELKETLCAAPVRVPRYFESRLKEMSNVLVQNKDALYVELERAIQIQFNPILVCIDDIGGAHELYDFIKNKFPSRVIKLLTGQESQLERARWLHAGQHSAFAGSQNAITIATQVCGRGTDIFVEPPNYLAIMQVGILAPRNAMQLKGRTARNNNLGSYQVFITSDELSKTTGLNSIDANNLSLAIELAHNQLIFAMRQKRLMLRMRGWFRLYLIECLDKMLINVSLEISQRNYYYLSLLKILESIISIEELNPEHYFEKVKTGFDKVLTQMYLSGVIEKIGAVDQLLDCLIADKPRWLSIATEALFLKPSDATEKKPDDLFSYYDLYQFLQIIKKYIPGKQPTNFVIEFLQKKWYPQNSLAIKSLHFLAHAQGQFEDNINEENWQIFYQALQAVMELYAKEEKESSFGNLNYWKILVSPFYPWVRVAKILDYELYRRKILNKEEPNFNFAMQQQLKEKFIKMNPNFFRNWMRRIFNRILRFFNIDFENKVQNVSISFDDLHLNCTSAKLQTFDKCLLELELAYLDIQHSIIRRIVSWLFAPKDIKKWLDLRQELPRLIKNAQLFVSNIEQWKTSQSQIAHFQLLFRERLTGSQEPSQASFGLLSRLTTSFFNRKSLNSGIVIESPTYDQEIRHTKFPKKIQMDLELVELVRVFPEEIKQLYLHMYKLSKLEHDEPDKSRRWMLLAILSKYYSPFMTAKIQMDFYQGGIKLLLSELEHWSNRRELMIEWDGMNPSLC